MKKVMGKQSMTHSEHTHSFCIFAFTPHPCKEKKNASSQSLRVLWINLMGAGKYKNPLKECKLASKIAAGC